MAVVEHDILRQRAAHDLALDQIMAQQPPRRHAALQRPQPLRRGVNALAHKGAPTEYILINILYGQMIGVHAAPTAQQCLGAGAHAVRRHLHPGLNHPHAALLQGVLHGPDEPQRLPRRQKGIRVQGEDIGVAPRQIRRAAGSVNKSIGAFLPNKQPVQRFQRAALAFAPGEALLACVPGPGPVQIIKAAARFFIQRLHARCSRGQNFRVLGTLRLGAVGEIAQQHKIQPFLGAGAAQQGKLPRHMQRLLAGSQ